MCDIQNCELLKLKEDFGLVPVEQMTEQDLLDQNLQDFNWLSNQFNADKLLVLRRTSQVGLAILGCLYFRGVLLCYTLERFDKMIPEGRFILKLTYSLKFRSFTPEIVVSSRVGIRIHVGNTIADTKGCVLVGISSDKAILKNSQVAFDLLNYNILNCDVNSISVINNF